MPGVGGQPDAAREHLQGGLSRAVVLVQDRAGSDGDDGLPEPAVVAPVHRLRTTAVGAAARARSMWALAVFARDVVSICPPRQCDGPNAALLDEKGIGYPIPRPGVLRPQEPVPRATFAVVLDTSGSMNALLLGKALGAVASYATARDVPAVRVVFCDAVAYNAGYLATADIAGRVTVRGRGGTILQPGVTLLQEAADFPPDAPILVITDAYCDVVRIRREHAFLVPEGARLPFTPRGPVFRVC